MGVLIFMRVPIVILAVLIAALALRSSSVEPPLAGIRFEEIASKSGLHFTTENSPSPNKNQIETMVAGAALFDYDGDGYLDRWRLPSPHHQWER